MIRTRASHHVLSKYSCASLLVLGSLACEVPQDVEVPPSVSALQSPVIGGTPAAACAWPSTVIVDSATSCTGTLIHPRIVTTAAHCLTGGSARVTFGAESVREGLFSLTGRCVAGARGESGVNSEDDWGYCVLPEDDRLKQVAITPPLVGCEAERFLKPGAKAWIVGYGQTSPFGGAGRKNQVEVLINKLEKKGPWTIDVGDADVGACHGDSGGPIYMNLIEGDRDYGVRVFGSTSGPGEQQCDCSCSTTYVNIAKHVEAIERDEGIDVTPCTDATGAWQPGPECRDMLKAPKEGTGTFPTCTVARTTIPIASCGAPEPSAGTGGAAGASGAASAAGNGGAAAAGSGGIGSLAGTGGMSAGGIGGSSPVAGASGSIPVVAPNASQQTAQSGSGGGDTARAGSSVPIAGAAGAVAPAFTSQVPEPDGGCSCSATSSRTPTFADLAAWLLCGLYLARRRIGRRRATAD